MACLVLSLTASLVMWFLNEMPGSPKASHFSGLQFLQDFRSQCPGFASVQQYLDNQGGHKSDL